MVGALLVFQFFIVYMVFCPTLQAALSRILGEYWNYVSQFL